MSSSVHKGTQQRQSRKKARGCETDRAVTGNRKIAMAFSTNVVEKSCRQMTSGWVEDRLALAAITGTTIWKRNQNLIQCIYWPLGGTI